MKWAKQLISFALFVYCVLAMKASPAKQIDDNSAWLKNILKRNREINDNRKRTMRFEVKRDEQFMSGYNREKFNFLTRNTKRDDKELIVRSKGKKTEEDLTQGAAVGLNRGEASHRRVLKEKKAMMTSHHRISKRNVNTSMSTQPSVTATTNPPIFILPPPPLPSFNIPPVCVAQWSCSGRCMVNATGWRSDEQITCHCDTACHEIFNDCCTDFVKYCGAQEPKEIAIKKFNWSCEAVGHFRSNSHPCTIADGLWMVSRCADDWPYDETRRRCENPTTLLRQASEISRYIPTISENVTFRNKFCAKCNRVVGNLEYYPVEIKTNVIPPEHYNFTQKVQFLLLNGAQFPKGGPNSPKRNQARRYCVKNIVDSCPVHTTSKTCENGPVALVSGFGGNTYKNFDCALCNNLDQPNALYTCFPTILVFNCHSTIPQKFSLNLDYKDSNSEEDSVFTVSTNSCGRNGLIFDDKLQECEESYSPPSEGEDKYRLLAWFALSKDFPLTRNNFSTIMKQYFGVERSQIFNVSIDTVLFIFPFDPNPGTSILYHLVRSTILLTPEQSFDLLYKTHSNSSSLSLRHFIHFEKPLTVTLGNITYTIIKTTSRPLSCPTQKVYQRQDYEVLPHGQIRTRLTNRRYEKSEYYGENTVNITTCEVYSPSNCETTQTGLTKNGFTIHRNLSLYHRVTGVVYDLGQYDVFTDSGIALCNLNKLDIPTCEGEKSCKGRCSEDTVWRTETKMQCSCDPGCYEVFNDCCADYTKYCGAQQPKETLTKKYNYTCENVGIWDLEYCTIGDGLWMVARCRPDWPHDAFRAKCEAPIDKLTISNPDLHGYLPVVGRDNTTFRNLYCAICNGVEEYDPWPLDVQTAVLPPESYNLAEKIRFLLRHGAEFPRGTGPWRPGTNQTRRYCIKEIADSCPIGKKAPLCSDGDVSLVSAGFMHYKNMHCAKCDGHPSEIFSCFPDRVHQVCERFFPQSFSLVMNNDQAVKDIKTTVSVYDKNCGRSGLIFDDVLQVCRVNWLAPPEKNTQERFYVFAWLEPPKNTQNTAFAPAQFQESLARYLNISQLQLFDINITTVLLPGRLDILFYLVSTTIALTPEESLERLSTNVNTSQKSAIQNFLHYTAPFVLDVKGLSYAVAKTTSRPLACAGKTTYTSQEYTLLTQERVFITRTNKTYEPFEYFRENAEQLGTTRSNITVCEKYIPAACNGSIVQYKPDEYQILVNLSIYVNKTRSLYNYGEYEILSNKSVKICQFIKVRIITEAHRTIREDEALGYITFIFFIFSILFLLFLLITYAIFSQLRTLPGKNLMNLAASLLLFEVFWLPSSFSSVREDTSTCKAMAIVEHYFLMASFASMSVIAFHTCKVFARSLPAPKRSEGRDRNLFFVYLGLVWLLPGIFIAICVAIDDQDVVKLGYGESEICWLTESNAYTYFVTIPIALLMLFNIIAFIVTAVYLHQHGKNTAARQASGKRQSNLSIYVKLSTLMGFTWLFGLLALVTSTTVFWYFFVILTSLQGVFITVAFVMNRKTLNLYRNGYEKRHDTLSSNTHNRTRKTHLHNDTKL